MTTNSEENKRHIVEGEGIDAVDMAMLLHSEDRLVQERPVNCLRKLAFELHLEALRAFGVASLAEQAAQQFLPWNDRSSASALVTCT